MFNSIVVAVDGSEQANKALQIGAELAAQHKARLGLVYVVDSNHLEIPQDTRQMLEAEHIISPVQTSNLISVGRVPVDLIQSYHQAAAESLRTLNEMANYIVKQAASDAKESGAEKIETMVEVGHPADRILVFAKSRDADLIISGRRGFSSLKGLLLGSTSQKISQLAECSCMTVK